MFSTAFLLAGRQYSVTMKAGNLGVLCHLIREGIRAKRNTAKSGI